MYCNKCGTQILNGEKFCKGCGSLVENNSNGNIGSTYNAPTQTVDMSQQQYNANVNNGTVYNAQSQTANMNQQPINNNVNVEPAYNTQAQPTNMYQQSNNMNVNQIVNPDTKKYAIISIVIGAVGIFFALFIGMSLWISVIMSTIGFNMAKKGKEANKKLALVGNILNGILLAFGILIYISILMGSL